MNRPNKHKIKQCLARILIDFLFVFSFNITIAYALPEDFVYVTDIVQDVILEPRYFGTYNFVGERIDGYNEPKAILSEKAASALKSASDELKQRGYCIKVWDAYRPQTAVRHFLRWAEDTSDVRMKEYFYPNVDKSELFKLGCIAENSGHSRGSTVDLTILDMKTGKEVDMGTSFDYLGESSHHGTNLITKEQTANRNILKTAMENAGFTPYLYEWWHYTLKDEPHPKTYFDFPVE
ncbi:MAG: M15 family metallopeptidase [Oscillospiraceae bacterium]|jgi:D-alanyl-D-alanine dipeptidase|nr:M15 family metallopeptidase [Oscillospiraceae bacterium]